MVDELRDFTGGESCPENPLLSEMEQGQAGGCEISLVPVFQEGAGDTIPITDVSQSEKEWNTEGGPSLGTIERMVRQCFRRLDEYSQSGAVEIALDKVRAEWERLANPVQREQLRAEAKKQLKALTLGSASMVDAALSAPKAAVANGAGDCVGIPDPEPWSQTVEGAALLDELSSFCSRHAKLPEG